MAPRCSPNLCAARVLYRSRIVRNDRLSGTGDGSVRFPVCTSTGVSRYIDFARTRHTSLPVFLSKAR